MNITVDVTPDGASRGFAPSAISLDGGTNASLCVAFDQFQGVPAGPPVAVDLLFVASVIYAVDQLVSRTVFPDGWTRFLNVAIPVCEPHKWQKAASDLSHCVDFLTGDRWQFKFEQAQGGLVRAKARSRSVPTVTADAVSLFSGGLDSLIGAINWLSENGKGHLALVGHHDSKGRVQADQDRVAAQMEKSKAGLKERTSRFRVGVWQSAQAADTNYRSRSFLFLSMGFYVAAAMGSSVPVIMPENGAIAVNVPLTPSRRGSCSTRTAHPFFLERYRALMVRLGLRNPLTNPLSMSTKGEAVSNCRDIALLEDTYLLSVSCAKTGHRHHWVRRDASHCGHCMPCLYRRAALHAAGLSQDRYGLDLCAGEIDLDDGRKVHANDARALFHFLRRNLGQEQIAAMLRTSSSFGDSDVAAHAAVVAKSMDEIRIWLGSAAPREVKRVAGLS